MEYIDVVMVLRYLDFSLFFLFFIIFIIFIEHQFHFLFFLVFILRLNIFQFIIAFCGDFTSFIPMLERGVKNDCVRGQIYNCIHLKWQKEKVLSLQQFFTIIQKCLRYLYSEKALTTLPQKHSKLLQRN